MLRDKPRLRASIRAALLNLLGGLILSGAVLYMVMHPSSCRYEQQLEC